MVSGLFGLPDFLVKNINMGSSYSFRVFVFNEVITDGQFEQIVLSKSQLEEIQMNSKQSKKNEPIDFSQYYKQEEVYGENGQIRYDILEDSGSFPGVRFGPGGSGQGLDLSQSLDSLYDLQYFQSKERPITVYVLIQPNASEEDLTKSLKNAKNDQDKLRF